MRITLLTLLGLIFVQFIYPQNRDFNGIKFNSQNIERSDKTSIFLNEGNPIELLSSFSISFDVSFWTYKYFGPILRVGSENKNEISVVYNQHRNNEISYIEIIESLHKKQIEIPFPKKELIRNKWYNIKLTFDRNENEVKVYIDKNFSDKISHQFKNQKFFDFVFGIKDWNNPHDFDVPGIGIKNILITENNQNKYFWSLNPLDENIYEDKISGSKLKLINPIWIYEDSKIWKKLAEIRTSDHYSSHLGVAYDSTNSRLIIDRREDLHIYDLITAKDSVIKYRKTSPAYWNDLFYNPDKQILYSYFTAMGNVSIYDLNENEWTDNDTLKDDDGHYFGSAKFNYPKGDGLFLLGGYGLYKVNNDLFKYNFVKKEWKKIKLKKNEMTPRAWFTFGKGFKEGEYLIYGGFGNESGNQELGFKSNYDLYVLNMKDSTITKLKLPEQKFNYAMLFNDAYLDKEDSSFYFLSQIDEGKGIGISLNKLELKTGKVITIGNKFWERSANKWMYSYLHYNKATNEFISVIFDSTKVELFSINYPPISESQITSLEKLDIDENYPSVFFLAAAGIISVAFILIYYRRKKVKILRNEEENSYVGREVDTSRVHFKNSVKLFGGLRIYDKDGKEIAQTLSPKLKEIFLLILMRSINNHHNGITSEELSSIIWRDSSQESVKSSRGVAINKLRKIFSSVDGIDLEFSDKLWTVKINNGSSCNYTEYLKFCDVHKKGNGIVEDSALMLMNIVDGGEFLKGISYEWLDSIKFSINNEVIGYLKQYCDREKAGNNDETLLKLCDVILAFDSVDTDAIKFKIKTLTSQGKLHIAKSTYGLFVAEYKRLYDENYPLSFEEIIKS